MLEVDLLVERGDSLAAFAIKSGKTNASDFFSDLVWLDQEDLRSNRPPIETMLACGGDERQKRTGAKVVPWFGLGEVEW